MCQGYHIWTQIWRLVGWSGFKSPATIVEKLEKKRLGLGIRLLMGFVFSLQIHQCQKVPLFLSLLSQYLQPPSRFQVWTSTYLGHRVRTCSSRLRWKPMTEFWSIIIMYVLKFLYLLFEVVNVVKMFVLKFLDLFFSKW